MATRNWKNQETDEEGWDPEHETNIDSLEEAVTYLEDLGHIVIAAYLDFGGFPSVLMRRMRDQHDGLQTLFVGSERDFEWFTRTFDIKEED